LSVAAPDAGYVRVGRVKDGHGVKGELFLLLFAGEAAWLDQLETIRLVGPIDRVGGPTLTYKVKSVRPHKNGLIAKCSELTDRNQAEALIGYAFDVPEDFLVAPQGEQPFLRELLGATVFAEGVGEIGVIESFSTNGAQDLLIVKAKTASADKTNEHMIPFVEEFVVRIDYQTKKVYLKLPDGLLEVADGE
jgi:16S rRNA processing protein RimM